MHKGQISTLAEVLDHYNRAPPAMIGHNEAKPLNLNGRELEQLEAFLETLSAPLETGAGQRGNQ
jgi:cytochrome c peroxidase